VIWVRSARQARSTVSSPTPLSDFFTHVHRRLGASLTKENDMLCESPAKQFRTLLSEFFTV
jgi:hypothetical protein